MNTTSPTTVRPRRETRSLRGLLGGLRSLIRRAWDALPAVVPYAGPDSLEPREGERRIVFNGRVVTMRPRPRD